MPEILRDQDGYLYEKNWAGQWVEKNVFGRGHDYDTRNMSWQEARDILGRQKSSYDGKPLYNYDAGNSSSTGIGSGTSFSGDGPSLAGLIVIFILAAILLIGFVKVIIVLYNLIVRFVRRHPRFSFISLIIVTTFMMFGFTLILDIDSRILIPLVILVPGFWCWLLVSFRLRIFFAPLNALLVGLFTWWIVFNSSEFWTIPWGRIIPWRPFDNSLAWFMGALPLIALGWYAGRKRWPVLFYGLNLVLIGGIFTLVAYHTTNQWLQYWKILTALQIPKDFPLLFVALLPVSLWGWKRAVLRWENILRIPNLILTGLVFWVILTISRPLWNPLWEYLIGDTPVRIDLALVLLILPMAVRLWRKGSQRWPEIWKLPRAILFSVFLAWLAWRTTSLWEAAWQTFSDENAITLVYVIGAVPLVYWCWDKLQQWNIWISEAIVFLVTTISVWWVVPHIIPSVSQEVHLLANAIPVISLGWMLLFHKHRKLGLLLGLLVIGLIVIIWFLIPMLDIKVFFSGSDSKSFLAFSGF
jgi:hypothetical protein